MDLEATGREGNSIRAKKGYCGSVSLRGKIQLTFRLCIQNKSQYSRCITWGCLLKQTYKSNNRNQSLQKIKQFISDS